MSHKKYKTQLNTTYNAIVRLWQESNVERGCEGHPGIPGPNGNEKIPWDKDRAILDGCIFTLQEIKERLYKQVSLIDKL